jgi:hypothetical protein
VVPHEAVLRAVVDASEQSVRSTSQPESLEKLPPKRLIKLGLLCGAFLLHRDELIAEPLRLPLQ